jgi:hypothetical protein
MWGSWLPYASKSKSRTEQNDAQRYIVSILRFTSISSKKTEKRASLEIREDLVQKAIAFLSHPSVCNNPEMHLDFLERYTTFLHIPMF